MPTFVLTVQGIERDHLGVRVRPGIAPQAFEERPTLNRMMQGAVFELRRPDGSTKLTKLVPYGLEAQMGKDGRLCVGGPPNRQPILLTLSGDLEDTDLPEGTEVWYVDEPAT